MCLLAMFYRVVEDAPLVVGANRDELYDRGGEPPAIRDWGCRVVAGVDPRAGGTWLGLNEHGVLVAVTNRAKSHAPPRPRSRGALARELLGQTTAAAAAALAARQLAGDAYAGCNVVCADRGAAIVVHAGDWLRVRPLPPGLHVLTAHDVNDASDRRTGHSLWWLGQRRYTASGECVAALRELCAQTGNGGPAICQRGPVGGTVSSTILALRDALARSTYLHAQGPPDRTPYDDYSYLLTQLRGAAHSGAG
jgi:uncharacterized protein with NRDE domain